MITTEFGSNLKKVRKDKGFNQVELASRMNMTQASMSQFEKGQRTPTPSLVRKFATALNTEIENLIGDSGAEFERKMLMRNIENLSADSIKKINEFVELIKAK